LLTQISAMGIITRQSIKNFFFQYWGILLGGIYTIFFVKEAFNEHPEYYGLIIFMINYMQVLLPVAEVSMPNVIIKFFPGYVSDPEKKAAFVSTTLLIVLAASVLVSGLFIAFGRLYVPEDYPDLFRQNYLIIIPLLITTAFFETFTAFSKALLKSTFPTFLKEAFSKTWIFIVILLYMKFRFSLNLLLWLYSAGYFLQFILLFAYLLNKKLFRFSFAGFPRENLKNIISYTFFTMMGGSALLLVTKLDNLMISGMIGIEFTAYYSIGLFISNVIQVPERSVSAISLPYISACWERKDIDTIIRIYKKTSINLFLTGATVFLLIWVNIDNFQLILGEKFGAIKYVVLFLGLGKLFDLITGANGAILITSSRYKWMLYLQISLVILVFLSNLWLIPAYGINGAALATALSMFVYNTIKYFLVYFLFGFQPFTRNTLLAVAFVALSAFLAGFIPSVENVYLNILLQTTVFSLFFFPILILLNLSEDIRNTYNSVLKFIFKKNPGDEK